MEHYFCSIRKRGSNLKLIKPEIRMKKRISVFISALLFVSIALVGWRPNTPLKNISKPVTGFSTRDLLEKYISNIYESAHLQNSGLDFEVFKKGVTGFINLKVANKLPQNSSILTLIDFKMPSGEKRMWVINMLRKELLLNTWVAHGQGSGDESANYFSDQIDSHASSLGFYLTDNVYIGKHGRSLRLDGVDSGFNINARAREIVLHSAGYVSQKVVKKTGHIGRSFGCPAVSKKVANMVINTIKDRNVLFINGNDDTYYSKYLNEDEAANFISQEFRSSVFAKL